MNLISARGKKRYASSIGIFSSDLKIVSVLSGSEKLIEILVLDI